MGLALRVNQSAPSATEQSLVAAVRSGNDAAFEELFSRYRDRIRAYAHGAVGDHARAEDITQDVFISALRRMRETERPISFKPWIYEIARNACIDEFRRSRRATEVSLDEDAESPGVELQLASPDPTPDVVAESRQKISNLRGAFGGLSENHHRILVMRELEGLSYGEIGKRLGMSRAMVESTLFRARKRLNQEFRELESGQRCQQVRSAIDRSELGSAEKILGIRERRQVARHMAYCQQCRQHAWMAGFDASSLKRRSIGQKIAALLPIGWWHAHGGGARHAFRGSSMTAAKATARLARYSEPLSQVGLGRAVTAAAALAVAAAGGGYVVAGSSTHHPAVAAPAAVTLQTPPAHATAVFLKAGRTVAGTAGAAAATNASSHRPGHKRGSAGARHHKNGPSGGHPGGGHAAPAPGSSAGGSGSSVSSTSAGRTTATHPRSSGGGRGLLGSLLGGGGSSSSRTRLPALPSVPSTPSASIQAPSSLRAPAQTAVNAVTQAANAAGEAVNSAEKTVNSIGNTASDVVGGATNLGGSGTGH